jgi:hypothetical protein
MARELPKLAPVECRKRAEDAAEGSDASRSVMWSLLAIAGELADIRRDLRQRR